MKKVILFILKFPAIFMLSIFAVIDYFVFVNGPSNKDVDAINLLYICYKSKKESIGKYGFIALNLVLWGSIFIITLLFDL